MKADVWDKGNETAASAPVLTDVTKTGEKILWILRSDKNTGPYYLITEGENDRGCSRKYI